MSDRGWPQRAIVTALFVAGWLLGLAAVAKAWSLSGAPRALTFGGAGYVTFMLPPLCAAFLLTRFARRLMLRAWGPGATKLALLGVGAMVAGFLSL